jgi:flagellar motor switch protein FliN
MTSTSTPEPRLNGATSRQRSSLIDAVGVTVETYLGSASMTVAELNALHTDSVVALDAALNASVELRVNGLAIAYGELVAVGDKFGVRITSLAP